MKAHLKSHGLIYALITAYLLYATLFIYKSSFVLNGERYFVLFDDAMISMRYAKNLAAGHGLVWNPGEPPVEGYTNPLWTLWMALFHLFPIPASKISLAVQLSGAAFMALTLTLVYRIGVHISESRLAGWLAAALTGFYMPMNNWALLGMEVSVLALLLAAAIWLFLEDRTAGRFSPRPYLILGFSTLVRVDMAVPFLVLLGFAILFQAGERKRHLAWGLGTLLAFLGAQTLFRLAYYGVPLPNTYYLKVGGLPLSITLKRGLMALYRFIKDMNWALIALPFLALALRRKPAALLLALFFLGQMAYSVYVGGDAWEHRGGANRYIAIAIPLFFVFFVWGVEQIVRGLRENALGWGLPISQERMAQLALAAISLLALVNFNYIQQAQLNLRRWLLLERPMFVEGNIEDTRIALAIRKITTPEAHIAVVTAGAIPYFSERPSIDLLGKNDAYIAHLPAHTPKSLDEVRPGHMKWDYDYSIGKLKPDLIVQLWGEPSDKEIAYAYIEKYYTVVEVDGMKFSARNDSPYILWEKATR